SEAETPSSLAGPRSGRPWSPNSASRRIVAVYCAPLPPAVLELKYQLQPTTRCGPPPISYNPEPEVTPVARSAPTWRLESTSSSAEKGWRTKFESVVLRTQSAYILAIRSPAPES